ncbi:uncharacterized protein LOC130440720 [Diorhabda sublineata]|uniref:uncharacterized protein LOC130440720 n=1 Tax=Diorhabda sublineata TaxID=1163346 RepID=UPI0024E10404|nr:uncharacterized protein LOC130440720 [Diorhabda sublineata]
MDNHKKTKGSKVKGFQFPENMIEFDPVSGKYIALPFPKSQDIQKEDIKVANIQSKTKSPLKPLDFKNLFPDDSKMSSKSNQPQNKRRLEPLNLNDLHSGTKEMPTKIRKIDKTPHSARRLFPLKKQQNPRTSSNRYSTSGISTLSNKRKSTAGSTKSSPLLNMEEVEQKLLKSTTSFKGYQFRSPELSKVRLTKLTNSHGKSEILEIPEIIVEECETFMEEIDNKVMEEENEPKTPDSTQEFRNLEQLCQDSPITTVCNLMQDTVLNSDKNTKSVSDADLELKRKIEKFIKEEEIRHKKFLKDEEIRHKNFLQDEEIRHQRTTSMLNTVLEELTKIEINCKENQSLKINRRSERLLKKSPLIKSKLLTSPVVPNSDLRKSTLKKNLVAKSLDYKVCSPRVQKAMSLYNSLTIFQTPKSDRKNLSARLQNQCLLLQDTPVHK